jgi:hypothetical protein
LLLSPGLSDALPYRLDESPGLPDDLPEEFPADLPDDLP